MLVAVLVIDIAGVSTIGVTAVVSATRPTRTAVADGTLLAVLTAVGLCAWVLALVAVAEYRRGRETRLSRLLIWCGLAINTIGSIVVALVASAPVGPSASTSLIVAGILAVAGAGLSFAYLFLLRDQSVSTPRSVPPIG